MEENYIVRSKIQRNQKDIPPVPLADYLISKLRAGVPKWGDKDYIVDVTSGTSVKFRDVESQSLRVASALARMGFKQGDVLYFVTYELAQLSVVQLAVWRLGGAVRGCFQGMPPAEYVRQIRETKTEFVLVDADTAPLLRETASLLSWPLKMISVGLREISGVVSFQEMLKDDGSACPTKLTINLHDDIVNIANTSGSTGVPKGVIHTHYTTVAFLYAGEKVLPTTSLFHTMISNGIGTFGYCTQAMCLGLTIYYTGKFNRDDYFDILLKHKPDYVLMYPFVATWFARCEADLARIREAKFLRSITVSGWMMDPTTCDLLQEHLPDTTITQMYGATESILVTITELPKEGEPRKKLKHYINEDQLYFSNGTVLPLVEAKSVDLNTGKALPLGELGEIYIRTPCIMKGYLIPGKPPVRDVVDDDNWLHTGDLGFLDEEGNLYIKERVTFTFKYCMQRVSPNEIETVVAEHKSVLAVGVVGMPHAATDSEARAFVVLKPGCEASPEEIVQFVAQRFPKHKQLHGGVRLVSSLPMNRGGKLDRVALKKMALETKDQ